MIRLSLMLLLFVCLPTLADSPLKKPVAIAETRSLAPELEKFRPYLGKTYRGEFSTAGNAEPSIDVSQWERALNGKAIRILHSLNDGEYGGESIIFYDKSRQQLRFYYFTTADFYTEGEASFDGETFVSSEQVTGNADGITEVVGRAYFSSEGKMIVESAYYKGKEKLPGSRAVYQAVEGLSPVFK